MVFKDIKTPVYLYDFFKFTWPDKENERGTGRGKDKIMGMRRKSGKGVGL